MSKFIGRQKERANLEKLIKNNKSEFIAVYGRRRVGKTFLINQVCKSTGVYFELTGLKDGSLESQLENFIEKFSLTFLNGLNLKAPSSWLEAFKMLTSELQKLPKKTKIILFFDELPWLCGRKSGCVQALDYYWNTRWSRITNLNLIVCGSAASWMIEHIINAKGGLYNRVTHTMLIKPFNLNNTHKYLKAQGLKLNEKQTLEIYMITGGIPYYLNQFRKGKSIVQNINDACFKPDGILTNEFERLFASLFEHAELNRKLITAINKKRQGISRDALLKAVDMKSGGTFNKRIDELEAAGFIQTMIPYGKKKKDKYYKLVDEYSAFYLKWIKPIQTKYIEQNYWQNIKKNQTWKSWSGYAFESICFKHTKQIAQALQITDTLCQIGSWQQKTAKKSTDTGAQIDLLFDRDDDCITLCEIKYYEKPVSIDKMMARAIINKSNKFIDITKTKKQIQIALITTNGLKKNIWSEDLIDHTVTLNDLFKPD